MGLDRPLLVQYVEWLAHALTGDLSADPSSTMCRSLA